MKTENTAGQKTYGSGEIFIRDVKFWGRNCLESVGLALGIAVVMFLFYGFGSDLSLKESLVLGRYVFPYYLFMGGAICILMIVIGYFQVYFSLVLAMNATRKSVIRGIFASDAAEIIIITALGGVIWKLIPGDEASSGLSLIPLLCGALFIIAAFIMILGVVIMRWGKIGGIIAGIVFVLVGGVSGAGFVLLTSTDLMSKILNEATVARAGIWAVMVIGVVLYIASGAFAAFATKKVEVRM